MIQPTLSWDAGMELAPEDDCSMVLSSKMLAELSLGGIRDAEAVSVMLSEKVPCPFPMPQFFHL